MTPRPGWWPFAFAARAAAASSGMRSLRAMPSPDLRNIPQTAMARSLYQPRPENTIEDYRVNNRYYHKASDTYFQMLERDGKYYQRRYQIGFNGKETNIDEQQIDFVMGSGNHARSYLHRTAAGALVELPLAWYSEKGGYWAMGPGYDRPDQADSRRKVGYECMFCHNAYPEIPAGHSDYRAEPVYSGASRRNRLPAMPRTGRSSRAQAQTPGATADAIRKSIVNPARLDPARQMEVCMQCHLETTSFPFPQSIRKYDREPFSYQAGEPLADFMLFFDHGPANQDRFQIVSSVYRLRMSECFLKSGGKLLCTTCHNPHRANIVGAIQRSLRRLPSRFVESNGAIRAAYRGYGLRGLPYAETAYRRCRTRGDDRSLYSTPETWTRLTRGNCGAIGRRDCLSR